MKYNIKKYPVLRMLKNEKLGVIGFFESDKEIPSNPSVMKFLKENFYKFSPYFKQHIYSQTEPFAKAILKSCDSLIRDDAWNNIGIKYGTILNMNNPFFKDLSVMYFIKETDISGVHDHVIYYFSGIMFIAAVVQYTKAAANNQFNGIYTNELKKAMPIFEGFKIKPEDYLNEVSDFLYTLLIANINFMQYANVETKILQPKQRIKDVNCKYTNDTDTRITILDSSWFTNLVKSESFSVRGHFRLQPCGQAFKDKKLIWIDEFQKTGYNRTAKILKQ